MVSISSMLVLRLDTVSFLHHMMEFSAQTSPTFSPGEKFSAAFPLSMDHDYKQLWYKAAYDPHAFCPIELMPYGILSH